MHQKIKIEIFSYSFLNFFFTNFFAIALESKIWSAFVTFLLHISLFLKHHSMKISQTALTRASGVLEGEV
jgi:hypothetical protein